MKVKYRNCEIKCYKNKALFKDLLFFSVFDCGVCNSGLEITSGYSEGEDTVKEYIEYLKKVVDDYIEHPEDYE